MNNNQKAIADSMKNELTTHLAADPQVPSLEVSEEIKEIECGAIATLPRVVIGITGGHCRAEIARLMLALHAHNIDAIELAQDAAQISEPLRLGLMATNYTSVLLKPEGPLAYGPQRKGGGGKLRRW